jgi:hypothetical protein
VRQRCPGSRIEVGIVAFWLLEWSCPPAAARCLTRRVYSDETKEGFERISGALDEGRGTLKLIKRREAVMLDRGRRSRAWGVRRNVLGADLPGAGDERLPLYGVDYCVCLWHWG